MITKTDLKIQNDSYTKKDFYEIYPELLDVFSAMTNTFDPKASNESDPVIVLLKLLAFTADKLNYNIDKSELENKLPSATQENSVRKICEMLGYDMGYIESAVTPITFMWQSADLDSINDSNENTKSVTLKAFETTLTDDSNSLTYTLTDDIVITNRYIEYTGNAIEGSLVTAEINSDNILRIENIDSNNRFYLPETSIASNGVFVIGNETNLRWTQKDNLNIRYYDSETRKAIHTIWKFGYDSSLDKPYIQFADDINEYIGNGLQILYIRSSGKKGNINAGTLTKLVNTELTITDTSKSPADDFITVSSDDVLIIKNIYATNTGKDKETINEAYNNYKKTINTFDTLITCMDYANYISLMKKDESIDNSYLVSNCQVSDIRSDLNNSMKLVTYIDSNIKYIDCAEKKDLNVSGYVLGTESQEQETWNESENSAISTLNKSNKQLKIKIKQASMDNFDLFIYPLNPINTTYSADTYQKSFKPITNSADINEIIDNLEDTKCIAHKIKQGAQEANDDIYLIKNYYSLSAKINTKNKVNTYEILDIKNNIYNALYENFNAHELEYGEEIPYDSLLEIITNSDNRIKAVSLEEPVLETHYMLSDGSEGILSNNNVNSSPVDKSIYRKLIIKNILAGRAPLFEYVNKLEFDYNETNSIEENGYIYGSQNNYIEPTNINPQTGELQDTVTVDKNNSITAISTNLTLNVSKLNYNTSDIESKYTLRENESLIIAKPKFITTDTYSSYVSYYFKKNITSNNTNTNVNSKSGNLYSNICNLKELNENAVKEYYKENSENKTIKDLVTELATKRILTIYRKSSTDLSAIPGYLIDADLNKYIICGSKVGSFYQTTWTYNENTQYFIDKSFNQVNTSYIIYDLYQITINNNIKTESNISYDVDEWAKLNLTLNNNKISYKNEEINWNTVATPNIYKFNESSTGWYELRRYTCGVDMDYSEECVPANTEYMLKPGEALYISLVDSDDVDHAYKYYCTTDGNYIVEDNGSKITDSSFCGIISPNFDLYASEVYAKMGSGHSYSKTSSSKYGTYYINADNISGMFSLGTSEELAVKAYSRATMKEQCYLYWLSNNLNKLTFTKIGEIENSLYQYEYILAENEYLWYTNTAKTDMITLGYGTRLILTTTESKDSIIWNRQTSENITLSDISQNGIGAFSNSDWILKNFNSSVYLTTEQMELTTLNEGIELIGITLNSQDSSSIDSNTWTNINSIKYKTIESKVIEYKNTLSDSSYRIKPLLNLNLGPSVNQVLSDSDDDISKQDIQIFTSYWCKKNNSGQYEVVKNSNIVYELTYNKANLYEYIVDIPLNKKSRNESEPKSYSYFKEVLKSNYSINQTGGIKISMHTFNLNGTNLDDVEIYPVAKAVSYVINNTSSTKFEKNTLINLNNNNLIKTESTNYIKFNTLTLENTYGVFSIYVKNIVATDIKLSTENANLILIQDYLNPSYLKINWKKEIELQDGLNTIVVQKGCLIKLDCKGIVNVKILDYKLIKQDAETKGLNLAYLGLTKDDVASFCNELNTKISNLEYPFYYDITVDNSKYIDVTTLDDPYSWFNVNNIFSQFTLAELDLNSFTNIDISRSSRLK